MSNTGRKRSLREAAARLHALGGVRAYYRGLTVCASADLLRSS